jgi:hypothetical protein
MTGTWRLTAPDGRYWEGMTPIAACRAEQAERVPADVALERVLAQEPAALPEEGTLSDLGEAADLVDKIGKAETKGDMLGFVLGYRRSVRAALLSTPAPQKPTYHLSQKEDAALKQALRRSFKVLDEPAGNAFETDCNCTEAEARRMNAELPWVRRQEPATSTEQAPIAYWVYVPAEQRGEFVHDLDEAVDDLTNCECEVTKLYAAPQPPAASPPAQKHLGDSVGADGKRPAAAGEGL